MKKIIKLLMLSLTGVAQNYPTLIIKDISIIPMTENKVISRKSIAITNGIIQDINDFEKLKKNKYTKIIDGTNQFVLPSLVEMHSHLTEKEKLDTILTSYIAAGVTRLRVMFSPEPVLKMKELISLKTIKPKIYYPYLLKNDLAISSQNAMDSLFSEIKKNGYDFVKMYNMQRRKDFTDVIFDRIMFAANKHNVIVCGHYPGIVSFDKVVNSGFKSIEHLAGYINIPDEKMDLALESTKKNKMFNCPTLDWDVMTYELPFPDDYKTRMIYGIAPTHYIQKWDNAIDELIKKNTVEKIAKDKNEYMPTFIKKQRILKKLNDSGNLLLLGGEAGNLYQLEGFNMYEEMMHWSKSGISNYDILRAATVNPAKFFNEDTNWGTIEIGKEAHLIILSKNPLVNLENMKTLTKIIIDSNIYDKQELLKKL